MGSPFKTPVGHQVIYETRRHWYEVLPEMADCLFWLAVILCFAFGCAQALRETRLAALTIVGLYPLGHFLQELVLWNHEWYVVAKTPQGKGKIFKLSGVFNKKQQDDFVDSVAIMEESTIFSRHLGFLRVQIQSQNRVYLEGKCVPKGLIKAIYSVQVQTPEVSEDADTKKVVMSRVDSWVNAGILDQEIAKLATKRWILEQL